MVRKERSGARRLEERGDQLDQLDQPGSTTGDRKEDTVEMEVALGVSSVHPHHETPPSGHCAPNLKLTLEFNLWTMVVASCLF